VLERSSAQHTGAERGGQVVAQRHRVERWPEEGGEQQPCGDERDDGSRDIPPPVVERAGLPDLQDLERLGVGESDGRHDAGEHRTERDAGEGEPGRARRTAADRADQRHDHRGDERAEKGEPEVSLRAGHPEQTDGERDEEGRTGVDPEDARVGEWVARHRLDDGTGHPQRHAGGEPDHGAGQAQVEHGGGIAARHRQAAERIPDGVQRDLAGPDGEARGNGDEQRGEAEKRGEDAPRWAVPGRCPQRANPLRIPIESCTHWISLG